MIYVLLAEGFEEVEAIAPIDILRRERYEVKTVSLAKTLRVTGAHGITVVADMMSDAVTDDISLLVLPGGMPGTIYLDESPVTDAMIEKTLASGGRLAAICAAPLVLGKRGLLRDKQAVCYPGFEEHLEGATVLDIPVVTDGNVTTCNGMWNALSFGKELVKVLKTGEGSSVSKAENQLFLSALDVAMPLGKISTSLIQRKLRLGYGKAAKLIDRLEELGFVSKPDGQHPRTVTITEEEYKAFRKKCEDEETV